MRESRQSGSVEGVMSNHDPYSDTPSRVNFRGAGFSSLLARRDPARNWLAAASRCRFNPRPRERRLPRAAFFRPLAVSIHAPAKGRLTPRRPRSWPFGVSIHAPAKGRPRNNRPQRSLKMFQSTPPRRGDAPAAPGKYRGSSWVPGC